MSVTATAVDRLPLKAMDATPEVTTEDRQMAREWACHMVSQRGTKYTTIADEIGVSRPAIKRFVDEDHGGPDLVRKILSLREVWEAPAQQDASAVSPAEPLLMPTSVPFVETEDVNRVIGVCEFCARESGYGLIVGHAGSGKTTTLRKWCAEHPSAVYVSADVTMNTRAVLEEISESLGVGTRGTLRYMLRQLIAALKREHRVIVIDEADVLVAHTGDTVRKLEAVRPLHDQAGASIVLAGLPRLKVFLTRGPNLRLDLEQIYSRVRIFRELKGLTNDEADRLLAPFPMTPPARATLLAMATSSNKGGLRRVTALLEKCAEIANAQRTPINHEIVQAADNLALH